jgi:hypothetical protein
MQLRHQYLILRNKKLNNGVEETLQLILFLFEETDSSSMNENLFICEKYYLCIEHLVAKSEVVKKLVVP